MCVLVYSMLKNDYFQKGGHDPEILAQIRDLEYEAQRMQATQRPQGKGDTKIFLSHHVLHGYDIHVLESHSRHISLSEGAP